MIRRIAVLFGGTPTDEGAALAACLLSKRLGAGVEGLSIKIDPTELMFRLGEGVAASAIDDILKAAERTSDEAAARAKATLEAAAKKAGIPMLQGLPERAGAGAFTHTVQGPAIDVLTAEVGLADLVVFGMPGDQSPVDLGPKIEHVLMHLRRPVLIAGGIIAPSLGDKILVAYNGTVEGASALSRAAPIVATAKATEILHLSEHDDNKGATTSALRYVRQHGGNATVHERAPSGKGIGEDIAARAKETQADLIVMGGYGRSRLRELVLGGATRHLMLHAPVPVLLAH
jgi:nucleotide-binding universal stress UspA family protein